MAPLHDPHHLARVRALLLALHQLLVHPPHMALPSVGVLGHHEVPLLVAAALPRLDVLPLLLNVRGRLRAQSEAGGPLDVFDGDDLLLGVAANGLPLLPPHAPQHGLAEGLDGHGLVGLEGCLLRQRLDVLLELLRVLVPLAHNILGRHGLLEEGLALDHLGAAPPAARLLPHTQAVLHVLLDRHILGHLKLVRGAVHVVVQVRDVGRHPALPAHPDLEGVLHPRDDKRRLLTPPALGDDLPIRYVRQHLPLLGLCLLPLDAEVLSLPAPAPQGKPDLRRHPCFRPAGFPPR
mmetsp:Transcript_7041/g.24444  ORF Transcript_7041/g.24444 Transcript_7041/m.24444 type:complete len:292 (-) Transcript_7041:248-1123(-)